MQESPYERYLRLPLLLKLQVAKTPAADSDIYLSELFFIVVHQAVELFAGQALRDLEAATQSGLDADETSRMRAVAMVRLMIHMVDMLAFLPPEHFMAFRAELDGISACQSTQFVQLFAFAEENGELTEFAAALREWQTAHCELAARMLGDAGGTGGSSGAEYLHARIRAQP